MDTVFTGQLVIILAIVSGVIAILNYLKKGSDKEKDNAVEIAKINAALQAQSLAGINLRNEMRIENGHITNDLNAIKVAQSSMLTTQADMNGDLKLIRNKLNV